MHPIFIHVMTDGSIWISSDVNDAPTGTQLVVFRATSLTAKVKLGTLTGSGNASASALAVINTTGTTGKQGKENNATH